jgi:hypothetical protein
MDDMLLLLSSLPSLLLWKDNNDDDDEAEKVERVLEDDADIVVVGDGFVREIEVVCPIVFVVDDGNDTDEGILERFRFVL